MATEVVEERQHLDVYIVCSRASLESATSHRMADNPPKRARLQRLRDKLPFISQSALVAVLKVAADEGLPAAVSRSTIARSRDEITTAATPYGNIHHTITIGDQNFEVQNPFAMLYHVAKSSPYVSSVVAAATSVRQPTLPSPYHLILYADEITPGNQLAYKGDRKFWAFYWTIAEFGSARLADEVTVATTIDLATSAVL